MPRHLGNAKGRRSLLGKEAGALECSHGRGIGLGLPVRGAAVPCRPTAGTAKIMGQCRTADGGPKISWLIVVDCSLQGPLFPPQTAEKQSDRLYRGVEDADLPGAPERRSR